MISKDEIQVVKKNSPQSKSFTSPTKKSDRRKSDNEDDDLENNQQKRTKIYAMGLVYNLKLFNLICYYNLNLLFNEGRGSWKK